MLMCASLDNKTRNSNFFYNVLIEFPTGYGIKLSKSKIKK